MKHTTMTSLRDRDFLRTCRRIIARSPRPLSAAEVAEKAAQSPAPAFYVSFCHALRRIRYLDRHGINAVARSESCRLYCELLRRVRRLMQSGGMSDADALTAVLVSGNAPEFYISRTTAAYLYSTIRRRSAAARVRRAACCFGRRDKDNIQTH